MDLSRLVDAELEHSVLGALLMYQDMLPVVALRMKPEDIGIHKNRIIYDAMMELSRREETIHHSNLYSLIVDMGKEQIVGGTIGISSLGDGSALRANVESSARKIHKLAKVRKIALAGMELISGAEDARSTGLDKFISSAPGIVMDAVEEDDGEKQAKMIHDGVIELFKVAEKNEPPKGLRKTGISNLDLVSGGLWPGLLTVLAARPAMGKSAVGLNIAINVAMQIKGDIKSGEKKNGSVLFFSLEDTFESTVRRAVARSTKIDLAMFNMQGITQNHFPQLIESIRIYDGVPLAVIDSGGMTADDIRMCSIQHKLGHGLDLIVVDHVLEIDGPGKDETEIASRVVRRLRDLAKELGVPVLALAQLNRKVEDRRERRPVLSDLKQTGRIEEVARAVWLLYRDGYYTKDESSRDLELNIAKNTHGKTGLVHLWADMSTMTVRDWGEKDGEFPSEHGTDRTDRQNGKQSKFSSWQDRYDY